MEQQGNRKPAGTANEFSKALNTEIRVWMTRRGLTLVQMAELSGVSKSRISKTVYKHDAPLNTNELDRLCRALDVAPFEIVQAAERSLFAADQSSYSLAAKHDPGVGADINDEDYF